MKKFLTLILLFTLYSFALPSFAKNQPEKSALDIREVQTHYYNTKNKAKVISAAINTLQDNGFIVQNVEEELGYIQAKKEEKLKRTDKGRVIFYASSLALNALSGSTECISDALRINNEIEPHTVIFESNVLIDQVGDKIKVRFSVIEKVLENADGLTTVKSSPRKVERHYEEEIYRAFFNQLNKNLFIEQSTNK